MFFLQYKILSHMCIFYKSFPPSRQGSTKTTFYLKLLPKTTYRMHFYYNSILSIISFILFIWWILTFLGYTHPHSPLAGSCGLAVRPKEGEESVGRRGCADSCFCAAASRLGESGAWLWIPSNQRGAFSTSNRNPGRAAALSRNKKAAASGYGEVGGSDTVSILLPVHFQSAA